MFMCLWETKKKIIVGPNRLPGKTAGATADSSAAEANKKKTNPIHKLELVTHGGDWLPERHAWSCVRAHLMRVSERWVGAAGLKKKPRRC